MAIRLVWVRNGRGASGGSRPEASIRIIDHPHEQQNVIWKVLDFSKNRIFDLTRNSLDFQVKPHGVGNFER